MSSIPLPALSVQPPQQSDPLDQYRKVASLKNLQQAQQLQQAQLQGEQLRNQQSQMDVDSQKALQKAYMEAQGDPDQTTKLAAKYGAKPQALLQWQKAVTEQKSATLDLVSKQGGEAKRQADLMVGAHDTLDQAKPEERAALYPQVIGSLQKQGVDVSQLPQQYPGDDALKFFGVAAKSHSEQVGDALKASEIGKNAGQEKEAEAAAAEKQQAAEWYKNHPGAGAPGVPAETASIGAYLRENPGASPAQYPAWKAAQEAKATEPVKMHLAIAEKAAEQAIADGDPKAAAQLLISGTVAPSQIISSRKPAFAQQAFSAAAQMQPGWNAQKADADFKVASSPQQVAFFGSAKSLTDKGGTLDQLADAAKDIPANQIPVFNTVADALKASTGSGPIAKYASIALGVADDYAKVMGGGMGSDTSRTQALNLISAKQSPEQRAASIEGIRGSVSSQTNSRIGNNAVLRKMYSGEQQPPASSNSGGSGGLSVKAPNGKTYTFKDQASADAFKQKAGIQ